jgi:hypothetical protein
MSTVSTHARLATGASRPLTIAVLLVGIVAFGSTASE